jgi:hypothetical protein
MQVLTVLFFAALVGIIVLFAHILSLERRKKMSAYAKSKGLYFSPDKDKKIDPRYSSFKCLCRGHSRYAYNIMRGKRNGRDLTAFDYHYVTGHGKSRKVHNFSALIIRSPLPLKPLLLRPENIFDKVTDFFGFDDIDFESAEFSRKFYVKSPEKRWAYHVIHQRMMVYLMESPRFHIQFNPEFIIAWLGKRFSEQDYDNAFALIQGILKRLPEYVKKQQLDNS